MKSKVIVFQSIICFSLLFLVGYYKDKADKQVRLRKKIQTETITKLALEKSKASICMIKNDQIKKELKYKTSNDELYKSKLLNAKASKTIEEAMSKIASMNKEHSKVNNKSNEMIEKQNKTIVALEQQIRLFSPLFEDHQTCIPISEREKLESVKRSPTAESLGDLYQD